MSFSPDTNSTVVKDVLWHLKTFCVGEITCLALRDRIRDKNEKDVCSVHISRYGTVPMLCPLLFVPVSIFF